MSKGTHRLTLPPMAKNTPRKARVSSAVSKTAAGDDDGPGGMDKNERKVLRRKKNLLATHIRLDDEWVEEMTEFGLVTNAMFTQLKVGKW